MHVYPPNLLQRLHRSRRRVGRRHTAGFTLLELMVVVILIGVLAALGVPSIAAQLRDRRTNQAAHEIALLYRQARSMAMGRGAAVLVRFDGSANGRIEVRESMDADPAHCMSLPATSCAAGNWNAASPLNRLVGAFDVNGSGPYTSVKLAFFQADGTSAGNAVEVCFSPLGRPYRRFAFTGAFVPMAEVPYLQVKRVDASNQAEGITRTVLVLPNGTSRLAL
ncbi:MAG TPA: prepilin-type N-terminal cleavage/methylation domain-containing protein [Polyangiaceae bacterium]|nr:prepilin-type N-terminal cleavage/methylation domain-containing protein [Polyangiaceae bacterium]